MTPPRLRLGALLCTVSLCVSAPALPHATADAPWPAATILSTDGGLAMWPDLTTAPDGTTTAVWVFQSGGRLVHTSTRPPGGSWSVPVTLSELGQNVGVPQVATGPDGITTAIWPRFDGSHFRIQLRTRPVGEDWKPDLTLSEAGGTADNPQIVYGADGIATAVWERFDGNDSMVQASQRSLEGIWTVPVTLSEPGLENRGPRLTVTPDGTVVVVWRREDSFGTNSIMTATHPAGGSWSASEFLSHPVTDSAPQLAAAADGSVTAVWVRDTVTFDHVRSRTRSPTGTWSVEQTLSEDGFSHSLGLTAGPDGTTAVWLRGDGAYNRLQVSRRPPGGAWTAPVTLSEGGAHALDPQVATGPDGTVLVLWTLSEEDAQVAFHPATGTWSTPSNVTGPTAYASSPRVAIGADGTTALSWVDGGLSFKLSAVVIDDLLAIKPAPPPVVVDTSAIKGKTKITKAKATYTFSSPTPGATFECRMDRTFKRYAGVSATKAKKPVPWKTCTSPYVVKAKKLKAGKHRLYVRAVLNGQVDATPSMKKLRIAQG